MDIFINKNAPHWKNIPIFGKTVKGEVCGVKGKIQKLLSQPYGHPFLNIAYLVPPQAFSENQSPSDRTQFNACNYLQRLQYRCVPDLPDN